MKGGHRIRRRQLGSFYDDAYNTVTGAAGVVANDAESMWNSFTGELNSLDQSLLGPLSAQGAINAGESAAVNDTGPLSAVADIPSDIESGFDSGMTTLLVIGAVGLIVFALLEEK